MKKRSLVFVLSCLVVSFAVFSTVRAFARTADTGRINFGKLKVIPSVKLQAVYDDNIFLGSGDNNTTEREESDWIAHIMPGLFLDYGFGERGGMILGYRGDYALYDDNDDNDWNFHQGVFNLDYNAPGGLIVGISEVYTDTEDPFGDLNQYNIGTQTKRWNSDLRTKLGIGWCTTFKLLLFYNYYEQDYDRREDYTQDYDFSEVGIGFEMRVTPKTWAFIRYHFGDQDYNSHPDFVNGIPTNVNNNNDADRELQRVNMGVNWDAGAKLSGEFNVGYLWTDFDNDFDAALNRYDDKDTWIAGTAVNYAATENTLLTLELLRTVRTTGCDRSEFFEDTSVSLDLKQVILSKFVVNLGGMYSKNDYDSVLERGRDDDNYYARARVDYNIQEWLTAGVGYKYKKKDSNYSDNDYDDNQVLFTLGMEY